MSATQASGAVEVAMPRLSDSMEEGVVLRWLKQVGDAVAPGDELAEIETDKAAMPLEAEVAGTLLAILVEEGGTAPLGAPLALVGEPGSAAPSAAPSVAPSAAAAALPSAAPPVPRAKASPVARRLAAELGVELSTLTGSGPQGRIVKRDVLAASEATAVTRPAAAAPAPAANLTGAPAAAPAPTGARGATALEPLSRLQQTVARRMAEARATIPDFTLFAEVDMSHCVALRGEVNDVVDSPISFNDLVVKATALALREHPRANAAYRDGGIERYERINVGVAVAREDALLVPVVRDAERLSLGQIARETRALAGAARDGSITADQLAGGTFTISNLGMLGVDAFQAIVNPGQAAILSVGALRPRPVVDDDGEVVVRPCLTLGLIADHRVLNGADAASLLARIRALLERPLAMAL